MTKPQIIALAILTIIAGIVFTGIGILLFLFPPSTNPQLTPAVTVMKVHVTATPNFSTPESTPTPIVLEFQGQGDDVIIFDVPATGAALIFVKYTGERHFAVKIDKSDGTPVDLLVNTTGKYEGETSARLEQGQYLLNISADGPWLIIMLPPQDYIQAN